MREKSIYYNNKATTGQAVANLCNKKLMIKGSEVDNNPSNHESTIKGSVELPSKQDKLTNLTMLVATIVVTISN